MKKTELHLGPFQGITDVHFRNVFADHFEGIDKFFTPFFSGIHTENSKNLRTQEIAPATNNIHNLVPQLLSNDPDEIIRFSEQCAKLGYKEVNLNMGCPYPQVARKKRGSGLMPYSDLVAKIAQGTAGNFKTDFSIKCRLGYYGSNEIDELIPIFEQMQLSELIVHARLGTQMYGGKPDHEKFANIVSNYTGSIVYNGDIFNLTDYTLLGTRFPQVSKWMLGRGILADPFLAADIKAIALNDYSIRKDIVYRFIMQLYLTRRKAKADNPAVIGRMKELWSYLSLSFSEPTLAWRLIRRSTDFEKYEEAVAQVFKNQSWIGAGFTSSGKMY